MPGKRDSSLPYLIFSSNPSYFVRLSSSSTSDSHLFSYQTASSNSHKYIPTLLTCLRLCPSLPITIGNRLHLLFRTPFPFSPSVSTFLLLALLARQPHCPTLPDHEPYAIGWIPYSSQKHTSGKWCYASRLFVSRHHS